MDERLFSQGLALLDAFHKALGVGLNVADTYRDVAEQLATDWFEAVSGVAAPPSRREVTRHDATEPEYLEVQPPAGGPH